MVKPVLAILALVLALRLPFLNQAIQGDDLYYLYGAEHAQIDPLHPTHTQYLFQGDLVDMRGQSHPPLNSWILGALLALFGDVREAPFHLAYTLFSVAAAMAMWSLARRFSDQPLLATLLFCAVPAFVVNGNSLEADLPFLALWMNAVALFVYAVDRQSGAALAGSACAAGLAGLAAYQGIFLTPILGVYLLQHRRSWRAGWAAALAAPGALLAWQLWERSTSGALPASLLAGYLRTYDFESLSRKAHAILALAVNLGWIVSPILLVAQAVKPAVSRVVSTLVGASGSLARLETSPRMATQQAGQPAPRWQWAAAILAALAAAFYDPNPLCWLSAACGAWLLAWCFGRGFLGWWVLIFFTCGVAVFFVGSARYLLPVAAPIAILAAEAVPARLGVSGLVLQLAVSLALATVNYQHAGAYRDFAAQLFHDEARDSAPRRVWINADWGLRWYLEAEGGLPLPKGQAIQPGEIVVTSTLANPTPPGTPLALLSPAEIASPLPLRLMSLEGRSAYSYSPRGSRPFEISNGPIDRVRAEIAIEPRLSYLEPSQSGAASQIVAGLFADGWMSKEARLLLKAPARAAPLEVALYVPDNAPARRLKVAVNGIAAIDQDLPGPGAMVLSAPVATASGSVTVTLAVDKTFSVPGDARALGLIIRGVGFRNSEGN